MILGIFKKLQILKKLSKNELRDNILPAPQLWNLVPTGIKDASSLSTFKKSYGTVTVAHVGYAKHTLPV